MPKQKEEFSFLLHDGKRPYTEPITIRSNGSDLYIFNRGYQGSYHISLHESGQLHLKLQQPNSLRKINKEEIIKPGIAFIVDRSNTSDKAVVPLKIMIASHGPWRPLEQRFDIPDAKIPLPKSGNVAQITVLYSNTPDLDKFQSIVKPHQRVLKSFPVHKESFYALVYEECKDPGILTFNKANPGGVTPVSSPADKDWDGDQYRIGFIPMTDASPHYILMLLLMSWQG
jgi:hypothetical protein